MHTPDQSRGRARSFRKAAAPSATFSLSCCARRARLRACSKTLARIIFIANIGASDRVPRDNISPPSAGGRPISGAADSSIRARQIGPRKSAM